MNEQQINSNKNKEMKKQRKWFPLTHYIVVIHIYFNVRSTSTEHTERPFVAQTK